MRARPARIRVSRMAGTSIEGWGAVLPTRCRSAASGSGPADRGHGVLGRPTAATAGAASVRGQESDEVLFDLPRLRAESPGIAGHLAEGQAERHAGHGDLVPER